MTPGTEIVSTRRDRRGLATLDETPIPPRASAEPRWSRRRGVMSVFATLAALGFVTAYIGPTGLAIADVAAEDEAPVSLYASSLDDVQTRDGDPAAAATEPISFDRGGYEVYVTPKPTPTPEPEPAGSGGSGSRGAAAFVGPPPYSGGGSPAEWMAAAGIAQGDWGYVDFIVSRESGWNPNATNSSSGACGLVQVYPCSKLPNAYDPVVNLTWANGYATGRYGSWAGAYNFWINNHWW